MRKKEQRRRADHASRSKHLVAQNRNTVFEFTPRCVATQRLAC